ncbi:MAG TPA: carbohydrate ABC transporter permease [bacterium]|mgnify:FL=1|nr:carbohydrate ABC transporter permease [bacterium]HQI49102.1 carbohydrate ABC transporter permease [bacterium]HQJ65816.1 carbohydrate ABC transporter permease [bacterium]
MKRGIAYLILILGAVVFLYPFLWMVAATLKPEMEIPSFGLLPSHVSLASYEQVFAKIPLLRALINSLVVSFSITASVLFFGSMVGYALSRLRFRGRELMVMAILFTMMIPFQLTMIPLYILMVKLHWTDTYLALIVPGMMSGFGILLFRQFFQSVPQSLIDAARVDGLSDMQILFRIIWPLSRPILITVGIITFMNTWNDVLWPLIVIRDQSIMTMPQMVTIFAVSGMAEAQLGVKLAAATLLALPVIVAYAFFQRYFIESLASTGLKG